MESRKIPAVAPLPTAMMFGLGIGNLWGIAGVFAQLGNPRWIWVLQLGCLAVLIAFLCGVARAWWARGAAIPLFMIVTAAWVFSAPVSAVTGKFTMRAWALWLLVLIGSGAIAYFVAWVVERSRAKDAMPGNSP